MLKYEGEKARADALYMYTYILFFNCNVGATQMVYVWLHVDSSGSHLQISMAFLYGLSFLLTDIASSNTCARPTNIILSGRYGLMTFPYTSYIYGYGRGGMNQWKWK